MGAGPSSVPSLPPAPGMRDCSPVSLPSLSPGALCHRPLCPQGPEYHRVCTTWILKHLLILPPLAPKDLPGFRSTGEVLDLSVLAQVMTLSERFAWLHLRGWGVQNRIMRRNRPMFLSGSRTRARALGSARKVIKDTTVRIPQTQQNNNC